VNTTLKCHARETPAEKTTENPMTIEFRDNNDNNRCLIYLFYSRKCVGDYAKKISMIHLYDNNPKSCKLTKLCLRSMMIIRGVFDYQGSLFEAEESLQNIALRLESDVNHSCSVVYHALNMEQRLIKWDIIRFL